MRNLSLAFLLAGVAWPVLAQESTTDVRIEGSIYQPATVEATDARIGSLRVPDGFRVAKFVDGLEKPRILAVADDGLVYVTRREPGDVLLLRDDDRNGLVDRVEVVAERPQMHGIAIDGDTVWLVTVREIYRAARNQDGTLGELQLVVDDLPDGGQHPNRTIAVGPDDMLYVSVGSTCNECEESNPEHATMLRMRKDGSEREIFASGLRNTVGFGWHPQTGALWGMDHGTDWLGDDTPAEELNRIERGKKYGWPYVFAGDKLNPRLEPPGTTRDQWAEASEEPAATYTAHAAPMQMVFYEGQAFPEAYRGNAFVAMRGSWNRRPPSGFEVVRIEFENGEPRGIEPFLTGFLQEDEQQGHVQFGRPVGLAQLPDGSLLVGDDTNGVIYRITHDATTD